jgi:hypothetical protein
MTSTISALTTGGGGIVMSGDSSGNLSLLSGATTVVAVTATGATVTGTLAATGAITGSSTVAGSTGILYPLTSGTAVASTSGTSIDFTGIPSWAKKITVMLAGVSTSGTSIILIQLGDSGGIETSGYTGGGNYLPGAGTVTLSTTGFGLMGLNPTASTFHDGFITLALQNSGTFTWVETGLLIRSDANMTNTAGAKSLSATLDRIRLTTVNGTDTFDAGSVNILYE